MADPGFPGQHTTTTTMTSNTTIQTNTRFDPSYIRTWHGILKCAQIVLNLLGFICIEVSGFSFHSRGSYFIFVSMTGFWFTALLLLFYLFHLIEKFYKIPWLKIELVFCALWTLMYLIAACLAATFGVEAYSVAAVSWSKLAPRDSFKFHFCSSSAFAPWWYTVVTPSSNSER
jgi:signal transduction histidine kinase